MSSLKRTELTLGDNIRDKGSAGKSHHQLAVETDDDDDDTSDSMSVIKK